jgi:hypothetical protein
LKLPLPILAHYRDHAVTQLASGFERDLYLLFCLTSRSETEFHQRSCVQNFGKFMNLMKEKHLENIAVCLRNKRLDVLALRIGEMIKSIDADFSRLPELPPRFTIDSITGLCQQHGLFFVTGRPIHLAQNRAVIRQGTERAGAI